MNRPVDDPFRRLDYRRRIAWPARIEREWPLLSSALEKSPAGAVIDLGCGTGEHTLFLASQGHRAVGIDRSATQIEAARDYEGRHGDAGPAFLEGNLDDLADLTQERFATAVCLGNVLPSLDDDELDAALGALTQRLLPDARLVVQILNYTRILEGGIRHLPLNFRESPDDDGEVAFLRVLRPGTEGRIWFYPTTLRLRPGQDPPIAVESSREVDLRAWLWADLEPLLDRHGFGDFECWGDVSGSPFEALRSPDLVLQATFGGSSAI